MQDIDVCYAFVEFEDVTGVQNAIEVWIDISKFWAIFIILFVLKFQCNWGLN